MKRRNDAACGLVVVVGGCGWWCKGGGALYIGVCPAHAVAKIDRKTYGWDKYRAGGRTGDEEAGAHHTDGLGEGRGRGMGKKGSIGRKTGYSKD